MDVQVDLVSVQRLVLQTGLESRLHPQVQIMSGGKMRFAEKGHVRFTLPEGCGWFQIGTTVLIHRVTANAVLSNRQTDGAIVISGINTSAKPSTTNVVDILAHMDDIGNFAVETGVEIEPRKQQLQLERKQQLELEQ